MSPARRRSRSGPFAPSWRLLAPGTRVAWALALGSALGLAALTAAPRAARAQQCPQSTTGGAAATCTGGGDVTAPTITFSPAGGTGTTTGTLAVTIGWCDDQALVAGTRQITLDGTSVTGDQYQTGTRSGCGAYATSTLSLTLTPGAHTLAARIQDAAGNPGQNSVGYTSSPAITVAVVAPRLYRDPALCTLDCGELVQSYSTPAYVSQDVARSLTFVYRSGNAQPRLLIAVDVSAAPAGTAKLGLQIVRDDGAILPLVGAGNEFVRNYDNTTPNRLAAQFVPNGYSAPADYARVYQAVVNAYDGQGNRLGSIPTPVRVPIDWVHAPWGAYGGGWGLAGVPEFHWTTATTPAAGGLVLVDAGGEIGYWAFAAQSGNVSRYQSPPGDVSTVTYDATANQLTRGWPDGSTATFDGGSGAVLAVRDALGNATTFGYIPGTTALRSITDPTGHKYTFVWRGYDPTPGEPAFYRRYTPFYVTDSLSAGAGAPPRTYFIHIDTLNDVRDILDAGGRNAFASEYIGTGTAASTHLMWKHVDRRGAETDYAYDTWNMLSGAWGPGAVGSDGAHRPHVALGSWAAAMLGAAVPAGAGTLSYAAPALPWSWPTIFVTDVAGATTSIKVDRWGAPSWVRANSGATTTTTRDTLTGNVTQTVDARGQVTRYVWDPAHPFLLDTVVDVAAKVTTAYTYTYDAVTGYQPQYTYVNGQEQEYRTYSGGRIASVRAGGTTQSATTYSYAGQATSDLRPSQVTDPRGHVTTYTYQPVGLQNDSSTTSPAGTTSVAHDAFGRVTSSTDPLGNRAFSAYDALNRPVQVTDANGHATTTGYDNLYARTVTDATNQVYRDSVNALGLPFFSYDPGGHPTATTYDTAGRAAMFTNRRGQTVTFGYDRTLGTLTSVTTPDGYNATYGTDSVARVRWARNAESADSVWTDSLGRDTLAVHWIPALPGYQYTMQSSYDALGRRNNVVYDRYVNGQRSQIAGNSNWTSYTYGGAGELKSINNAQLSYNNEFAPMQIVYGGNTPFSVTRGYTDQHTLGSQRFSSSADNALGAFFSYDGRNRVTERYSADRGHLNRFSYDSAGQLRRTEALTASSNNCTPNYDQYAVSGDQAATWTCTGPYNSVGTSVYAWDAVGNPAPSTGTSVITNSGNELAGTPTQQFGYDTDGNLVTRFVNGVGTVQRLTWNSLGQLVQVQSQLNYVAGNPTVTFGYDAGGRRVRKTVTVNGAAATTYFVWDGADLAADVDAGGNAVAMYTYYPGGPDRPFSVTLAAGGGVQSGTYYYVTEPPGHVTGLVDWTGATAAQYPYGAFGPGYTQAVAGAPNGWVNRLQFGAREYDAETGLYYNRARYYDPSLGRFISQDPAGLAGGINPYVYAGNDPVDATDPTGLDCSSYAPPSSGATACLTPVQVGGSCPGFSSISAFGCTPNVPNPFAGGATASNWEAFLYQHDPIRGPGRPQPPAPPNQPVNQPVVNCSTVLPDGRVLGNVVREQRALMQGSEELAISTPTGPWVTFFGINQNGGAIDFKNTLRGRASPTFLAAAGNFAYYAVGYGHFRDYILDAGAGAYGLATAVFGSRQFSNLKGHLFSDASAAAMRDPALASRGCGQ